MIGEAEKRDLGSGFECELRRIDGVLFGVELFGPQGANCTGPKLGPRCHGWVPVTAADRDGWTLVSEDPLTLTPSIRCGCDMTQAGAGQHGFITDGRWVNAGGITA